MLKLNLNWCSLSPVKANALKPDDSLVSLSEAGVGTKLRVRDLKSHPSVCQRLREMGFCELAEIHKVADGGALICHVCGSRVALSRSLGKEIIVEPVPAAMPRQPS